MLIPPEKVQEILERTDLVALVSRHVELRKSGRTFLGLCPFHAEKTPSFNVNPERRFFKCFGCDASGDAITFLQRLHGRSFVETVRELAREAGIEIEQRVDPAMEERSRMLQASELARRHFEERLWNDPRAALGRQHLEQRNVPAEIARQFSLGYALNSWNDLGDRLVKEGALEWGARAGLCAPRQSGGFYDVFRGRLMVPIRSPEGRTIAFGARRVEEMQGGEPGPKYLNSRESPLYRKAETLYGLDLAKEEIRRQKTAVLVEGYFDVIGLYSAGVRNAVALCSTALTPGHLAALSRVDAKELVLLLDGDAAGLRAVERLAGPILATGTNARVATLPEGDDPDTFAFREGAAAVERLLDGAPALSAHLLHRTLPRGLAHSFEEKMAAVARLKPVVEQMAPGMAKDLFIAEIAAHVGVAESSVRGHLMAEPKPARPKPAAPVARPVSLNAHEALYAALLIADPTLRDEPAARFHASIRDGALRVLLELDHPEAALDQLPAPVRKQIEARLAEIAHTLGSSDLRRQALKDASRKLRLARTEEEIASLIEALQRLGEQGASDDEILALQTQIKEASGERKRLRERSEERAPPGANDGEG